MTPCVVWHGTRNNHGYGKRTVNGKSQYAHRVAYVEAKGPIPDGLEIDHLCRNRACINPDHLEAVTHAENIRRGGNSLKTHCPRGHAYDDVNTYRRARGDRICKACSRAWTRTWKLARKAALA